MNTSTISWQDWKEYFITRLSCHFTLRAFRVVDFYSSHVNPLFWGLHEWIDDRIDDWFKIYKRGTFGEVKEF